MISTYDPTGSAQNSVQGTLSSHRGEMPASGRILCRRSLLLAALCVTLLFVGGCLRKPGEHPSKLTYKLPTTITVAAGNELPGTDIRFEGLTENAASLLIRGQTALKRKGDSVDWSGTPIDGVFGDLKLRVVWYTEEKLHLLGTAKVVIEDVDPQPASIPTTSSISYGGAAAYGVSKGAVIPGSTIVYEGRTEDGARLGGIEGYPYRKEGDSIVWEGTLRSGVYARLSVRVVQFDDKGMRVLGLVTLWIGS